MDLAPVVRRVDSTIHWITQLVLLVFIRWIVIYRVDNAIHLLNNGGLGSLFCIRPEHLFNKNISDKDIKDI